VDPVADADPVTVAPPGADDREHAAASTTPRTRAMRIEPDIFILALQPRAR
jgi:hypothetical protein